MCWPRERRCVGDTEGEEAVILFLSVESLSLGLPPAKELISAQQRTGEKGHFFKLRVLEDLECKLEIWAGCSGNQLDITQHCSSHGCIVTT